MKINLTQILESTILLEGRKEDAIKKYGEEHEGLITALSQADPSGNNYIFQRKYYNEKNKRFRSLSLRRKFI